MSDDDDFVEWLAEVMRDWKESERDEFTHSTGARWNEFIASDEITDAWEKWERDAWDERMETRTKRETELRQQWDNEHKS
jgi:hypothetical protein